MTEEERTQVESALGHRFSHPEILERALTHRSHRQQSAKDDNERLEFLGDRVLGLVTSEYLSRTFPDWDAGQLSKGLAKLVSAVSVYTAARRLSLGHFLRLGPGEEKTGGREKQRLLADAYEAVTGAIYLDSGLEAAARFLRRTLLDPSLSESDTAREIELADNKSALQEWLQQRNLGKAEYRVGNESGPDHRKLFEVEVWQGGRRLSSSTGRSKKEAEQGAARLALETLQNHS